MLIGGLLKHSGAPSRLIGGVQPKQAALPGCWSHRVAPWVTQQEGCIMGAAGRRGRNEGPENTVGKFRSSILYAFERRTDQIHVSGRRGVCCLPPRHPGKRGQRMPLLALASNSADLLHWTGSRPSGRRIRYIACPLSAALEVPKSRPSVARDDRCRSVEHSVLVRFSRTCATSQKHVWSKKKAPLQRRKALINNN